MKPTTPITRKKISFSLLIALLPMMSPAQDTFSICAVDPVTGQVGSAGATCINSALTSAIIISDVHPGVGVIHTQAAWLAVNQDHARTMMNLGYSPQQIIDSITAQDTLLNPAIRQYGVVSLDSGGRSAAYTGINCYNYKNHITGQTYSIQGNILAGQQILDSMQARFLNTSGNLACRLMAALQGAKVTGADKRCNFLGISSISAFIRVANPGDSAGNFFLDLTVNTYQNHKEPIDTLQALFEQWGGCSASYVSSATAKTAIKIFPNPVTDFLTLESSNEINNVDVINSENVVLRKISGKFSKNLKMDFSNLEPGIYFLLVRTLDGSFVSLKFVKEH